MLVISKTATLRRMQNFALKHAKEAKKVVRQIAHDTGDMERAITAGKAVEVNGNVEVEVFVNTAGLGDRRSVKYKGRKVNKLYPIYVHKGTKYMKSRPFFTIAFENIKDKFKDVRPEIKVEDN